MRKRGPSIGVRDSVKKYFLTSDMMGEEHHKKLSAESEEVRKQRNQVLKENNDLIDKEMKRLYEYGSHILRRDKSKRKNWRGAIAGGLVGLGVGLGLYTPFKEPVEKTASVIYFSGESAKRVGEEALHLKDLITGRKDSDEIEKAQRQFVKSDSEYFENLRELLNQHKKNIDSNKERISEMRNIAEGFGRYMHNAPGFETVDESEFGNLRKKLNSLMSRPFQSQEEIDSRLSKEYETNYNSLLQIAENADKMKSLNKREIEDLTKKIASSVSTLETINQKDAQRLDKYLNETNELYDLTRGMRNLQTGEIREGSPEYKRLVEIGEKYNLNRDSADYFGKLIAEGLGALIGLYGASKGSKVGRRFIPGRRLDVEKETRRYLEDNVDALVTQKEASQRRNGLEEKVSVGLILFFLAGGFIFNNRMTGNVIKENVGGSLPIINSIIILGLFISLIYFVSKKKFYK
ncbi:hypothetical protein COU57_06365 [Candidatus Pacearchaeota archaeon CG10_big_fil_rev_8_21_14_0_10_32_14]|nr:MAG: hypothetical protein COU57_06365 [Candidatus Pacearchaeota archaeon CG10_big_fil_rev_8_21_14_0_10_32_14]